MPYTFAHIGFILPLKKRWENYFSLTGLVFGCIAPDYDILFRFTKNRFHIFTYDLPTIFLIIYPLAFLSAFAFHLFCRNILIDHLPDKLQQHFKNSKNINIRTIFIKHFFSLSLSILLAIFLHLFLDYLCHYFDAYDTKVFMMTYSTNKIILEATYQAAIYLLPVVFTLLGFYLILRAALRLDFHFADLLKLDKRLFFWFSLFIITLLIIFLKLILSKIETSFVIDFFLITITSSFITAFYLTCMLYYFYFHLVRNKKI